MLLALLLAGCSTSPLDTVPIEGGTDAQREAVQAELDALVPMLGDLDVRLSKVRFARVAPRHMGEYNHVTRTLLIDFLVEDAITLRHVVRHEVCHAVDFQMALKTPSWEGLDTAASWYRGRGLMDQMGTGPARREAFALALREQPASAA